MSDVRVRFEIATLGHQWRDEVRVTRTPLVDNLIAAGRLVVLEELPDDDYADEQPTPAVGDPGKPVSWFAGEPEPAPQV